MSRVIYPAGVREVQPRGVMLDESEAGYVRTSAIDSNLAFVGLMPSTYNTSINSGTGTVSISQQYLAEGNPYGTLDGLLITVPAGTIALPNQATLIFYFSGRKLSLHWDRYRASNTYPLTGFVNGHAFSLDNTMRDTMSGALGGTMFRNGIPVPVPLYDDGPHECKIHIPMDLSVQKQYLVYGYGVEQRFANVQQRPVAISRYLALTTSLQSIGSQGAYAYGIRGLQWANPNLGAANITIERDSQTLPVIPLANNAVGGYDFLDYVKVARGSSAGSGIIRVKSDVAGVQMWMIQRTE